MKVAPDSQPQASPEGQAPAPQQAGPSPEQAIQMIQSGYEALSAILQKAGPQALAPEDMQLIQTAAQATQAMILALTGGGEAQHQGRPAASQPMPANAGMNSQPAGPQGR